ncbi:amidohydrolase family protein [Nocardia sp. R6R-6]|uniref:amidohydrolase family protein n=1 Tax=Nocardia sp. R6R-6 TaxID=3459303 RepID=UPI00403DC27F
MAYKLIRNGWIVSMDPEIGELRGGSVLIEDTKIVQVGTDIEAPEGAEIIDATGMIVHPGLIDTHKHLWQAGLRGVASDTTLVEYMHNVRRHYLSRFRPEDVRIGTYIGALELIDGGTTSVLDFSHGVVTPAHSDALVEAMATSGIRGVWAYGYCPVEVEGKDAFKSHAGRVKEAYRVNDAYFRNDPDALLRMGIAITEQNLLPAEMTENEIRSALDMDLVWTGHTHCGPGNTRVTRGFHHLVTKGLVDHRAVLSHCNEFSVYDFEVMAELGAHFSSSPDSETAGGYGPPVPYRNALLGGIQPSLSTDCVVATASSMYTNMRVALTVGRRELNQGALTDYNLVPSQRLSVRDVFRWATIEGAKALGLDGQVGSLTPGKLADLVLVDTAALNMAPVLDPVGSLVKHANTGNVDTVILNGAVRKRGGKLVAVDVRRLVAEIEESKNHLTAESPHAQNAASLAEHSKDWADRLSSIS